jgi:hypothetical protein
MLYQCGSLTSVVWMEIRRRHQFDLFFFFFGFPFCLNYCHYFFYQLGGDLAEQSYMAAAYV